MRFQRPRHLLRRSTHTWRRTLAAVLGMLLLGSLAACGEQHNAAPQPERPTLHIGIQPLIDDAPLFIAQAKKLFTAKGLQVQLIPQENDAEAIKALKSGQVDLAFGSDVSLLKAAASGTKLRIAAEAYQAGQSTMAISVPQQVQYANPGKLGNVTVAVNQPDGLGTMVATSTLAALGVDADDINFVTMPFKDMGKAVAQHKVTGAWMEEPYLTRAERKLGIFAIDTDDGGQLNMPLSAYATTSRFAKDNPNTMRIFRTVLSRAQDIAKDRREVQKVLPQYSGVDATTAALVSMGTYPTTLSAVRLQRVADRMQSAGLLSTRLDVQQLVPADTSS